MIRMLRLAAFIGIVALTIGFAAPAQAQLCFGPDGLQGNCWEKTPANLPDLPEFKLEASGICWNKCDPQKLAGVLEFQAPNRLTCGVYDSVVTMNDAAGVPQLVGRARLDYTRTWEEADPNGRVYQVWRFLTKVDFSLGQANAPSCIVPRCAFSGQTVFYYGYVDYALECNNQQFFNSAVLFHPCDRFIHDPRHSSRPGVFHPDDYFALVAPDNAATPFTPFASTSAVVPPAGAALGAVRLVPALGTPDCVKEERLQQHVTNNIGQACACPLDRTRNGVTAQFNQGDGSCPDAAGQNSNYAAINTFIPGLLFPWLFTVTHHVGAWGGGAGSPYPGPEAVYVNEGFYRFYDSCSARLSIDVSYGAMTERGFQVKPDPQRPWQATDRFLDIASNYSRTQGINPPFTGQVFPTQHLIYVNIN
ncbi:MAG: hypothetical protein RL885_31145 [Planctomycetota bacterium]